MENQADKKFTWVINNFSSFGRGSEIYSDIFVVGPWQWRLIVYPKGTYKYGRPYGDYLSLYICVPDSESLPSGWRRRAKISLTIANQITEELSKMREAEYWFNQNNTTCGFESMINYYKFDLIDGFIVNGQVKIVAEVDMLELIDNNGFHVLASEVESVNSLFSKYPGFASKLCPQSTHQRETYVNVVLSLTEIVCKAPEELSNGDLAEAYSVLRFVKKAGFKLDWLEKKLKENGMTRLHGIKEELKDLKVKCADMDALLEFLQ
ncbi:hypothetical protein CARUB_v10019402mg [Capsella rubella]|uniref:MATH domain-containing protein n=1 Tax=Capsella rubella TaxID=81985 RepID=R0FU38_9BRAS|nr:MATH domain and coiled-coil domain-containing protein At3g27040 [Capsella rubella]EOA26006.1 hypothetical protein CARUB_v10019402mg [Capsella rubella]